MSKGKVLMAMSGGIDSSIAAALLHQEGYEVIGITMKTWDYATSGSSKKETGCCNLDTINDARAVAVKLGFPHYILDLKEEFQNSIIKNFISEYLSGFTPNPCVLCNALIKWKALLKRADALGCDFIATGHYAKIRFENNRYVLSGGKDEKKDQSYVLWQLTQDNLKRTLFPLGDFTKLEVKKMALDMGFDNLATKKESYEICFVPDDDYRSFLKQKVPDIDTKIGEGDIVDMKGNILGKHKGFPFYTIGQRKGLEIAAGYPLFVKEINAQTNTIVLGKKQELDEKSMLIADVCLIKYKAIPDQGIDALIKIRYKDKGAMGTIFPQKDNTLKVVFYNNVSAITPGQSAVFFDGKDVVGGGIIKKILHE